MARFCIAAVKASDETLIDMDDPGKGTVQIRAVFHSGPIFADVVGSRYPKYTLFGDTVNTACRMESNLLCGRIQCSDTSGALVIQQDPTLQVVPRGKIKIKSKGEMNTFWIKPDDTEGHPMLSRKQKQPTA
jgi:class 3 adenylate cyclase